MDRFWPGPLTLLFPTNATLVPDATTCGLPTVAVRIPSHPIARALISLSGLPVAAPSANVSGRPSPTRAEHVLHDLAGKVRVVLDGGPCGVGVESTVVDGISSPDGSIKVLRLGGVGVEEIEDCLKTAESVGEVKVFHRDFRDAEIERHPTTPGMKYKHYSPEAKVVILDARPRRSAVNGHVNGHLQGRNGLVEVLEAQAEAVRTSRPSEADKLVTIGLMFLDDGLVSPSALPAPPSTALHVFSLGSTPTDAARLLFAGLRRLDELGCDLILVQKVDETGVGAAFMERARKAAGGTDQPAIVVEV